MSDSAVLIGATPSGAPIELPLRMANRHGLIAGATGTGKTVTLQILAEGFAAAGVPVFLADIKGDLSGLARAAEPSEKLERRAAKTGVDDYRPQGWPVVFWDLFARQGHAVRTTISEMGPLLLANLFELNETQEGVLYAAFRLADDQGLLLLDLKDLRALLSWMGENARELQRDYGNLSPSSIAAIQRRLLVLEDEGAAHFFGEPALQLEDLMRSDFSGQGVISVLDATALVNRPRLYASFLLWLLAELFEQLPETGDPERPRLVFFFDEAHLLFDRAPRALLEQVEQVVRLIRSKGVGVYFITQNPLDIPEDVLGQLGNRVQHALRAFTPKDQKAVRAAAQTFRANPQLDTEAMITTLGVGEALVSVLDAQGRPTPVEHTLVRPPSSRIGPLSDQERNEQIGRSPLRGRYDEGIDRESAYELLQRRGEEAARAQEETERREAAERESRRDSRSGGRPRESMLGAAAKSAARSIGTQLGRQLARGLLGALLGSGRR
jgi:DNA helicase HerA-like ATPase